VNPKDQHALERAYLFWLNFVRSVDGLLAKRGATFSYSKWATRDKEQTVARRTQRAVSSWHFYGVIAWLM